MASAPRLISSSELSPSEARWITLKKLTYIDQEGKERTWECAERKTRRSSTLDAVAILAIIRSRANSFGLSTVLVEQYRPPINKAVIELPAGLVDKNESPEDAAVRELYEETGYVATRVIKSSPVIVSDPGMTNANMKLVVLEVLMEGQLEIPDQHLDIGEHIVRRVVELRKLESELQEYNRKGYSVDARLFHLATGYTMASGFETGLTSSAADHSS
jgi:ADP-ribose pyrophosphatase